MDLFNNGSYLGIIVLLVLTGMGLPLPEEVPIIAAGIASSDGSLPNVWLAFVSCVIGAVLGDSMLYAIGYHFGHNLAKKHPRFAHLLHADREAQIEEMIRKHGLKVFFLARFMIGIRAPMYLTAGILRMPFRRFIVVDAICNVGRGSVFWFKLYLRRTYQKVGAEFRGAADGGSRAGRVGGICLFLDQTPQGRGPLRG